jgi:hypothetical protein
MDEAVSTASHVAYELYVVTEASAIVVSRTMMAESEQSHEAWLRCIRLTEELPRGSGLGILSFREVQQSSHQIGGS